MQRFGSLDILINCAAGNFLALPEGAFSAIAPPHATQPTTPLACHSPPHRLRHAELSPNGFKTVMDIDAVGTFTFSRAAFPALRRPGVAGAPGATSCIVNISATLHYGATWYQAHACAAKAAVDALTRALALEWGAEGVRVCGVAPGPIAGTAGMAKLAPGAGKLAELAAEVPVGRLGSATDIAWAVVYLVSRGAGYVSGETLVVDGAAWLQRPQLVPRAAVSSASRAVEGASRAVGLPPKPKL